MGRNLSTLFISQSYQFLTQISGSELQDGLGNKITGSLAITSSQAISSSFATTASFALNGGGGTVSTASLLTTASAANNIITFTKGDSSQFTVTVATGSAVTVNTGSLMVTGSVSSNTLTFTKGDGSTFNLTVNTGSAVTVNTGSLLVTASISNATTTFTKGDGSTFSITANNVVNATSASYSVTADTATSASFATSAATATSASFASFAVSSSNSATSISSSYSLISTSSSFATSAQTATSASFATNAATATSASFATNATSAATASFLPSNTNLNVASITANSGSFQVLSAVSASFGYVKTVTGSAVIVGEEFIILNADTPAAPFAGVVVYDSGSASTASFEWNGNTDNWITVEENGFSAMVLTGVSGSKGSEVAPASNKLLKGTGNNTVADSSITDNGTNVTFTTPIAGTQISASTGFNGNLTGTASFATSASFAPSSPAFPFTGSAVITGSLTITGSLNVENTASIGLVRLSSHIGNSQAFIAATSNDLNIGNASYSQAIRLVGTELIFSNVRTSFPSGNDLKFLGGFQSTGSATISGSFDVNGSVTGNVLGNNTDTYTSSAAIQQVVTLTQAEYNAISGSANANTFYVISDSIAVNPATFATTGSNTFNGNQIISGSLSVTGGITGSMLGTASFAVFATGAGGANSATSASYALSASFATSATNANTATSASFATSAATANTASFFSLASVNQNAVFSGSVRGEVKALSIASNTASLDCATENFFTLTLVSGSNTFINPSNIAAGQTINLRVTQANPGNGTVSFPSSVKQVSGSSYTPSTGTGPQDIVTFISFDASSLYLSNVKNLV